MTQKKQQNRETPEVRNERSLLPSPSREGMVLFLLTQAVLLVALAIYYVLLRWRTPAGMWPTMPELRTPWLVVLTSGLALAAAVLCVRKSKSMSREADFSPARRWVLLAALLCLCSITCRFVEIRSAVKRGIYPRRPRAMLYDRADILYLQAVRQELEERYGRLEEKLRMRPNEFSDEDRADLERVVQLQTDMVGWTEMDLALRLDDNESKKARIATVAYQVQPLGRLRPQVEASLADEKQLLQDWRSRLELQKDYFSAKSRLQRVLREWKASTADDERVGRSEEVKRAQRALEQLDEDWLSRKDALPAVDQAALTQAMSESSDWSATTQLAKSLDIQLGRVEGRQRFLKEFSTLQTDAAEPIGLNQQYPWLKLPMLMPGANRWASSYHLMTGWHTVHLLLLFALLLSVLMTRLPTGIEDRLWRVQSFGQFSLAAWLLVFGVLHFI